MENLRIGREKSGESQRGRDFKHQEDSDVWSDERETAGLFLNVKARPWSQARLLCGCGADEK